MKRLYVAFALIILSLVICLYSNAKIEKASSHMQQQLALIGEEIKNENSQSIRILLYEAENEWKSTETLFSFIVDADKIEEINIGFTMIKKHLGDGNREHALERLRECELMLAEITENEKLSVKNIM